MAFKLAYLQRQHFLFSQNQVFIDTISISVTLDRFILGMKMKECFYSDSMLVQSELINCKLYITHVENFII